MKFFFRAWCFLCSQQLNYYLTLLASHSSTISNSCEQKQHYKVNSNYEKQWKEFMQAGSLSY